MKNTNRILVAVMAFSCICSGAFAQKFIPAGSLIGGGAFSFAATTNTSEFGTSSSKSGHTEISFTPGAMFFVTDDLGIGAGLALRTSSTKGKEGNTFESSSTDVTFQPMVRYYFAEGPFAQAAFGIGSSSGSSTSGGSTFESKQSVTLWEAGVGYSVRVTDTILIDPMIGYGSTTYKDKDNDDYKDVDGGFFIRVGFTLILIQK